MSVLTSAASAVHDLSDPRVLWLTSVQAVSAAAIFIGDNKEAVTAFRSDGRGNCSKDEGLYARAKVQCA
jgi:hypothetical protein